MSLKDLHQNRERLLNEVEKLNDQLRQRKEAIEEIDRQILGFLVENGLEYIRVGDRRYEANRVVVHAPKDWDAIWNWVLTHKAPFILQRRLSQKAIDELIDNGEIPDGIICSEITKLRAVKA
jgi:hypothetical protein